MFWLAWLSSCVATGLRLGAGYQGEQGEAPNAQPIVLYEFEACPFCKIAREQVSASGLKVEMRPCPKNGERYRPELVERGGKAQFPYMIDPNTGTEMYESGDIAAYVRKTYGGRRPVLHWLGPFNPILANFSILIRGLAGQRRSKVGNDSANEKEFLLKGQEWQPGTRLIREILCSRQIHYIWDTSHSGPPHLVASDMAEPVIGARNIDNYLKTL